MTGFSGDESRSEVAWPVGRLDRIGRLRALAEGLSGTAVEERVIAAPFDEVWGFVSDLERAVPLFDDDVARIRITRRDGDRLRLRSTSAARFLWFPAWFDVVLQPGWCLMRSRPQAYVIAMAAEPLADGSTRFAHLEGVALPWSGPLRWVARPVHAVSRWRHRVHLVHDVDGIEREVLRSA